MGSVLEADLRLSLNKELDVLSVSDRVQGLLGYSSQDFLNARVSIEKLLHLNDAAKLRHIFDATIPKLSGELNVRFRHADGRIRSMRLRYEREDSETGAPMVRVRMPDTAPQEPGRPEHGASIDLHSVMESMVDQRACVKDQSHRIQAASPDFRKMFPDAAGQPRALTGLTDYDLYPEEWADRSYALDEQVLSGESTLDTTQENFGAHGEKECLHFRRFPVRGPGDQIIGILTMVSISTKSVQSEQALRESGKSLEEVEKVAGIGRLVVDLSGGTWTGSAMLYKILGLSQDANRKVAIWSELIHHDDMSALVDLYGKVAMDKREDLDRELRFTRQSDQAERWAHFRAKLAYDAEGNPRTLRGTLQDISDRKEAEAKLQESSNLLQIFIHDAPTGLAMFNRQMGYISASRRWIEDHGLKEWDYIGRRHFDLGYKIPDHWRDDYRRALAGETVSFSEDWYEVEVGSKRWVRRMVQPWLTGRGDVGGIVILSEDITERKLAEEALRESEKSLNEAQNIARIGSYILDIPTGIWKSSEALNDLFGIDDRYDRTVDGWKALIHPDDRAMMSSHLADEVLGKASRFSKEYRIVRPANQGVRWVHGLGKLEFDAQGNLVRLCGTIQDITERKQADAALHESRELLQLFIKHAPAAIAMFDREMRYVSASRRWLESYLLEGQELTGRRHYEVFPDIPQRWKEAHRRGIAGEALRMEEDRFERADGTVQWLRWEIIPWTDSDGRIGGIVLATEDITAQKEIAERLKLAANVFTHASEGIVITDPLGAILDANDAFTRISGYERAEVLGLNPRILQSGRHAREFYVQMWEQLIALGHWSGEVWNRAKSGKIYAETLNISAVPDESGRTKQYVAMFSDITSMKEKEQQLKQVAHFDLLTGLPNRVLLEDRLRQAMAQAHRLRSIVAVAYFDLDDWSTVNGLHGHIIGDQLLTTITRRLNVELREGDTLARLGGDEFVAVLLDLADVEESLPRIEHLLRSVHEPIQLGDLTLQVSASIGVTFFPQTELVEPDQLLRQADQAMYYAKLAGKGRYYIFDPKLDRSMRGRHEDLHRMRMALEAGEFQLYFQPRVNMCTGSILGAEALIRWNHPDLGLLAPAQFLPIMEGNPLIVILGEWVLRNALREMEQWRKQGLDIPVSVNVDALQLQQTGFVDRLKDLLAEFPGIPASHLELEVLESSALRDVAQVSEVIRACGELGIAFALDDFGTGYSSLSYLKRLPVEVLKIDQSFVHDMLDDPEDLTILEGILGLAKAFRRQAVAEGVETVDHGVLLLRLGCQVAQGFGIARPMPGNQMPAWAAEWHPDPRWMNVSPVEPAYWPLLYASAEHRAWIGAVEEFIVGRRHTAPTMDHHHCRFGLWLDAEASVGRGENAGFQLMDMLHQRLHGYANGVLKRSTEQGEGAALAGLSELYTLRDGMLERLQSFVQSL